MQVKPPLCALAAGFETTSNALAYTVWMLVKHPSVQCRVYEEIDAVCGSGDIGYDELTKLRYTEAVLKETLRFYPVAAMSAILANKMKKFSRLKTSIKIA